MTKRRPNFLLISTDQQRADHLGCYGAQGLRTPNIDGLAVRGTRFERAYVASPVCMPNRSSLVTGRMPSLHGVRHNGLNLALESRTFVDELRAAGYRTSLSGKAHFQCVTQNPAQLTGRRGHEARAPASGRYDQEMGPLWREHPARALDLPYYGFEHVDLAVGHGDQVDGHYNQWVADQGADLEDLRGPDNAHDLGECPLFQAWRTRVPEHLYPTTYVQTMTEQALARYGEDASNPFFHWASFCDPHHPFTPPGRYWDMYKPEDMTLPASFDMRDPHSWAATLHDLRKEGGANLAGTGALGVSEDELRWATALTFGLITMIDDAVGAMLAALKRHDLDRDTIVIFLSDHGDLMGDHGLIFKGPFHYQSVIRMPLIWHDPQSADAATCEGVVSAVDVSASVLDAANVPAFQGMNGQSFIGNAGRDAALIEDEVQGNLPGSNVRGRARSLVTRGWRLTIHDKIEHGEMFDLNNDPLETRNLWHDPTSAQQKAQLIEQLLREMLANSETGKLPDYAA